MGKSAVQSLPIGFIIITEPHFAALAVIALSTGLIGISRYSVTDLKAPHIFADSLNDASIFVSRYERIASEYRITPVMGGICRLTYIRRVNPDQYVRIL